MLDVVVKLGIRSYLLVILGTLSAAPILALSTITVRRASSAELERADRDSSARASAVARELDLFMAGQVASVELLAGHVEAAGGITSPRLQAVLSGHRTRWPQFSIAYVANREGMSIVADPPYAGDGTSNAGVSYSDRAYYHDLIARGRTTISHVQLGRRSGVPNVQIASPVRDGVGQLEGFVEGSVDLRAISEAIASALANARDSRVIVTDASNRVLADSRDQLGVLGDVARLPLFAPAAGTRTTVDERQVPVRVAVARTTELGWTVTAIREQSSIEALADAARTDAIVIALITLLVALVVVSVSVHWLAKPIRALAKAATAVGRGDFSKPVPAARRLEAKELAELLGAVGEMTASVRDHNEQAQALIDKLETVNDELRTMVVGIEHAGNAIEVADANGRLIYVNPAWVQFTGIAAAEALGRSFVELLATEGSFVIGVWTQLVKGEAWRGICPARRAGGKLVEIELDAVPVMRADGTISHVVATRIDLTEQRRAEEVLRMNDRLAAVGTLAAGVAHEINNPLTYVSANLGYLRQTVDALHLPPGEREEMQQVFREAMLGVERVTDIVRDLKQLSRTDEKTTTQIDVNNLLESSIRMANLEIRQRAALECSYGAVAPVLGNEARLAQVFLNLLINAAQACDVKRAKSNVIRVTTSATATHTIIEIADTGRGIEPEVIDRIFDAFFTTKPIGVGTGLGLSICHNIVQQLGGTIAVESTPGVGSTFRVTLPAVAKPALKAPASAAAGPAAQKLRILVVDDEESLAVALKRMLRDHQVAMVSSAADALRALEGESFDIVLSDIMMPGLNGFELYERVRVEHAQLVRRFVFMTGGIIHPGLVEKIQELGAPCLYKPFTRDELLEMVTSVARDAARAERVAG